MKTFQELQEAVEWPMKYPGLYDKLGHSMPRGILLHGPSGTGKTCSTFAYNFFCI